MAKSITTVLVKVELGHSLDSGKDFIEDNLDWAGRKAVEAVQGAGFTVLAANRTKTLTTLHNG
jgi:phage gp29-like protein